MNGTRYAFVGNRNAVLEAMIELGLDIDRVLYQPNRFTAKFLENQNRELLAKSEPFSSKAELISKISSSNFDVLISNGCPYLLPIKALPEAKYVNIHPSFLPDLRGVDPVIGSLLFSRDSGATCHVMDEKFDNGAIISQERIPFSKDLNAKLLYQLTLIAEKKVFQLGHNLGFEPQFDRLLEDNHIYFSRSKTENYLRTEDSIDQLLARFKAFNTPAQGVRFRVGELTAIGFSARVINNQFIEKTYAFSAELELLLAYEDEILFKFREQFVIVGGIDPSLVVKLSLGMKISESR